MATSIDKTNVELSVSGAFKNTVAGIGSTVLPVDLKELLSLTNGTGAGQSDQIFFDRRTLGVSANEELDFAGGVTDAFGNTMTFSSIETLVVVADSGNTNNVIVGGAAANALLVFADATDKVSVQPSKFLALTNSTTVTAGTGDLLKIENSGAGTGVTYKILAIGKS